MNLGTVIKCCPLCDEYDFGELREEALKLGKERIDDEVD